MSAAKLYDKGRQAFLEGGIAWITDNIKAVLVDIDSYGLVVTAATNASPIQITTSTNHGLSTGDKVYISKVGGNTAANGVFTVTVVNATNFTLDGSTGNGAYTSSGFVIRLSVDQYLSDIPSGARIATSSNLTTKTSTKGVADADDVTFTSVSGAQSEAIVLYKDTGTAGTSPLILFADNYTGLPVTPNGANIVLQWDNGSNRIFSL